MEVWFATAVVMVEDGSRAESAGGSLTLDSAVQIKIRSRTAEKRRARACCCKWETRREQGSAQVTVADDASDG